MIYFETNFAVDGDAAKAFAEKIKVVVAERDLEGLASLTSFPVYVGLPGVSVVENMVSITDYAVIGYCQKLPDKLR